MRRRSRRRFALGFAALVALAVAVPLGATAYGAETTTGDRERHGPSYRQVGYFIQMGYL